MDPFPFMVWLPARALMGDLDDATLVHGVIVMLGWFVLFVVVNRLAWRRGLARYSSMGS